MSQDIVIVGAGVIGLTCAWILSENDYKVKIIASNFPSTFNDDIDYTSPWAGAHFRPFPSTNKGDLKDYPLTRVTFDKLKQLSIKFPESSIKFMKGIDYIEANEWQYKNLSPGYAEGLSNFKIIVNSKLPPNVKFGAKYDSWCLNSPLYLQFLERRLKMYFGVEFIRTILVSLEEVSQKFPNSIIINCSGMGLDFNGSYDPDCFRVRGQTLLIRPPKDCMYKNVTVSYRLADNKYSFVIPRPFDGGIIVGGTRQPGNLKSDPDIDDKNELVSNALERFPELAVNINGKKTLDIKKIDVGFRPMRKGGIRLEREVIKNTKIIHCYGFGSSGFEMSWGAAELVLGLIKNVPSKF